MMKSYILFCFVLPACFFTCISLCWALDSDSLQDTCPTATATAAQQPIFINGFPCKNPATVTAADFKSSKLNQSGNKENFARSSTVIVTALDFPGLNTLGLAAARTDLEMDGLVLPHSHPRASEMFYVSKGVVIAGFIDTKNQLFQKFLRQGDVFVFPRGLLHYCVNAGFESATAFSVLNSQNPGMVSVAGAMFDSEPINKLANKLISLSASGMERVDNVTLFGF
ncbi:Germin-like protein subfamily 3 member 4 [Actinidia chinensis var. chinensis]|uniref:Germin-like protein n=1 Tax=Actinidia chinensis var. chinensis TaxID=1590841 RepID=A0A2R6QG34_ACTCC|nr:Germin-like protein subfamily 3 member 4 [Actinidia chinensis var. chinensis]